MAGCLLDGMSTWLAAHLLVCRNCSHLIHQPLPMWCAIAPTLNFAWLNWCQVNDGNYHQLIDSPFYTPCDSLGFKDLVHWALVSLFFWWVFFLMGLAFLGSIWKLSFLYRLISNLIGVKKYFHCIVVIDNSSIVSSVFHQIIL